MKTNKLIHSTYKDQYGIHSYSLEGFVDDCVVGFGSASKERVQHELNWYLDNFEGISVQYTTITEELKG